MFLYILAAATGGGIVSIHVHIAYGFVLMGMLVMNTMKNSGHQIEP